MGTGLRGVGETTSRPLGITGRSPASPSGMSGGTVWLAGAVAGPSPTERVAFDHRCLRRPGRQRWVGWGCSANLSSLRAALGPDRRYGAIALRLIWRRASHWNRYGGFGLGSFARGRGLLYSVFIDVRGTAHPVSERSSSPGSRDSRASVSSLPGSSWAWLPEAATVLVGRADWPLRAVASLRVCPWHSIPSPWCSIVLGPPLASPRARYPGHGATARPQVATVALG
jgi:hypothetical protein